MRRLQASARAVRASQQAAGALPAQPNQSLLDGLMLLQALAVSAEPAGVRELARALDWNVMRVNRLLKTLSAAGLARQTTDRRYTAGPAMHVLSVQSLYASGLLPRAVAAVRHLPVNRHSVALGVLWQDQVCYLFHARPGVNPAAAVGAHDLYPATYSSIGMMLLAMQNEEQVQRLYAHRPIEPYKRIEDLLAALKRIREAGHAYIEQSHDPLTASVAVPIGTPPYAALALASDITPAVARRYLPALHAAARDIAGEDAAHT